jgi:hypothetical protein
MKERAEEIQQLVDDMNLHEVKDAVLFHLEAVRKEALEDAAKCCDNLSTDFWADWKAKYMPHDQGKSDGAEECAAKIRKLS